MSHDSDIYPSHLQWHLPPKRCWLSTSQTSSSSVTAICTANSTPTGFGTSTQAQRGPPGSSSAARQRCCGCQRRDWGNHHTCSVWNWLARHRHDVGQADTHSKLKLRNAARLRSSGKVHSQINRAANRGGESDSQAALHNNMQLSQKCCCRLHCSLNSLANTGTECKVANSVISVQRKNLRLPSPFSLALAVVGVGHEGHLGRLCLVLLAAHHHLQG